MSSLDVELLKRLITELEELNDGLEKLERGFEAQEAGGEAPAVALRRQRLQILEGGRDDA